MFGQIGVRCKFSVVGAAHLLVPVDHRARHDAAPVREQEHHRRGRVAGGGEATGGELTIENDPDHEAIDVAWLPLDEAHRHLTFPNERRIAREAWLRLSGDA